MGTVTEIFGTFPVQNQQNHMPKVPDPILCGVLLCCKYYVYAKCRNRTGSIW